MESALAGGAAGVGGVVGVAGVPGRAGGAVLVHPGLELLLGLAQGAGQLRQLRPAEEDQNDQEDDEQLRAAERADDA